MIISDNRTDLWCYFFCGLPWQYLPLPNGEVMTRYHTLTGWKPWKYSKPFIEVTA